ncbi:MAG: hypothetical protein JSW34_08750 [Candidatus Zixiibacteriota bacterium]|nr:MAG: hypothetical protein JSW34_08750 [candidate division Zixibacteria bacterium]
MRCEDARQWMADNPGKHDRRVAEHVSACPSCARFAEADRLVGRMFRLAASEEAVPSFEQTRSLINARISGQTIWEKIMLPIKDQYLARPRFTAGLCLAVITVLFITLVPFSVTRTVAYQVSLSNVDARAVASSELVTTALLTAGLEDLRITSAYDEVNGEYEISGIPSEIEAREIAEAVRVVVSPKVRIAVKPVVRSVSATIYAQVADKVKPREVAPVRVRFEDGQLVIGKTSLTALLRATGLTDEEVQAEIEKLFAGMAISHEVKVQSAILYDGSATRSLVLRMKADSLSGDIEPEIEVFSDDDVVGLRYGMDSSRVPVNAIIQFEVVGDIDGKEVRANDVILRLKLKKDQ